MEGSVSARLPAQCPGAVLKTKSSLVPELLPLTTRPVHQTSQWHIVFPVPPLTPFLSVKAAAEVAPAAEEVLDQEELAVSEVASPGGHQVAHQTVVVGQKIADAPEVAHLHYESIRRQIVAEENHDAQN